MDAFERMGTVDWSKVDHDHLHYRISKRLRSDVTLLRLAAILLHMDGDLPKTPNGVCNVCISRDD